MYIIGENQYVSEKDKKTYFQVTQSFGRTSLIFRGNYVAGKGMLYYYDSLTAYSDGDAVIEQPFRFEWNTVSDRLEIYDDDGYGVDVNVEGLLESLKQDEVVRSSVQIREFA